MDLSRRQLGLVTSLLMGCSAAAPTSSAEFSEMAEGSDGMTADDTSAVSMNAGMGEEVTSLLGQTSTEGELDGANTEPDSSLDATENAETGGESAAAATSPDADTSSADTDNAAGNPEADAPSGDDPTGSTSDTQASAEGETSSDTEATADAEANADAQPSTETDVPPSNASNEPPETDTALPEDTPPDETPSEDPPIGTATDALCADLTSGFEPTLPETHFATLYWTASLSESECRLEPGTERDDAAPGLLRFAKELGSYAPYSIWSGDNGSYRFGTGFEEESSNNVPMSTPLSVYVDVVSPEMVVEVKFHFTEDSVVLDEVVALSE